MGLFWKVQGLKFTFRTPEMFYFESNTFVDHSEDCVKMVISAVGGGFAHRAPELKLPEKAALTQLEGVWTRFGKDSSEAIQPQTLQSPGAVEHPRC